MWERDQGVSHASYFFLFPSSTYILSIKNYASGATVSYTTATAIHDRHGELYLRVTHCLRLLLMLVLELSFDKNET